MRSFRAAPLAWIVSLALHAGIGVALWFPAGDGDRAARTASRPEPTLTIRYIPRGPAPAPRSAARPTDRSAIPWLPPMTERAPEPIRPELPEPVTRPDPPEVPPLELPPLPPVPDVAPAPPDESDDSAEAIEEPTREPSPPPSVGTRTGPERLDPVRPEYPRCCIRGGHEGTVELILTVDARGRVTAARVVASAPCPELDRAAREAALSLRYAPAEEDGTAVAGETRLRVRFQLEERR